MSWLGAKAAACQATYRRLRVAQLVSAAAIPFVNGWQQDTPHLVGNMSLSGFLSGLLGVGVVLFTAIQQTGKYHENWINYRQAAESLKSEQHLHTVGAGRYGDAEDPDRLLAERVEDILQRENQAWVSHTSKDA